MPQLLPTALDENVEYEDFYESTLDQPLNISDTDIYPVNLPMSDVGILVLGADTAEPEIVFFNEKGANYIRVPSADDGEGRGVFNTTPKSWDEGTKIGMYSIAAFFEAIVTGRAMRNGFLEQRHFSSDVNPNNWVGLGQSLTFAQNNGSRESIYTATGDLTNSLSPGVKFQLPRVTNVGYQCADLEASSSQYASKASPSNITFTDDFTVEAWIKLESYTAGSIVSRYNGTSGWRLHIDATGRVSLEGYNGGPSNISYTQSYRSLPLGRWVHVAAMLDMSSFSTSASPIYFDGVSVPVSVARGGTNPTALAQAGDLAVGASNSTSYIDGKVSDARVWSSARTQAQVRDNMYKRLVGTETNLVSYFKLSGNFDDSTSNNNHLTGQGSASATASDAPFTTTEYAIITNLSYAGGTTTITVYSGSGTVPAETVTNGAYSSAEAPFGFPVDKDWWRLVFCFFNTNGIQTGVATSWTEMTNSKVPVPVGAWELSYTMITTGQTPSSASQTYSTQLSPTGVVPIVDSSLAQSQSTQWKETATSVYLVGHSKGRAPVQLDTLTHFSIWGIHISGSSSNIYMERSPAFIIAECAYV